MALLRLLARDSDSVALLPTVVVQDELRAGRLVEYGVVPDLHENFYAISVQRRFAHPIAEDAARAVGGRGAGVADGLKAFERGLAGATVGAPPDDSAMDAITGESRLTGQCHATRPRQARCLGR